MIQYKYTSSVSNVQYNRKEHRRKTYKSDDAEAINVLYNVQVPIIIIMNYFLHNSSWKQM